MKNSVSQEYADKAERDRATAMREMGAGSNQNYDAVCFHAQQCIEKLLKAALVERGIQFPKTHDFNELCKLLAPSAVGWTYQQADFDILQPAAVLYRYPGQSANAQDAADAIAACERLRTGILKLL